MADSASGLRYEGNVIPRFLRLPLKGVDVKGELFASTFTYGATAVIKLASSLFLTRLLSPEAYGIFGIILSILFIIELTSDVGAVALLVRHPRGKEQRFVHTVWTTRLIRGMLNASIIFFIAPLIARVYDAPVLTHALRIISVNFALTGAESMAFILAQRDRKARISNYVDFGTNLATTLFVVLIANYMHDYYALIYGMIFQRCLTVAISYMFYRDIGVGVAFDREAMADQFRFARFVMPSSILTVILSQYDKLVLLKLFDLAILGYYGIAQNMLGPITGVVMHNARVVLYARCAEYHRTDPARVRARFYSENKRLLMLGVLLPASVAGFANVIIQFLYDARYTIVGSILTILGLGGVIGAFHHSSENLLVAVGRTHVVLVANIIRLFTIVPATVAGYYLFGFYGFLWFNFGASIILLMFFYYEQKRFGLLDIGKEIRLFSLAAATFLIFWGLSYLALSLTPSSWLHIGPKRA